MKPLKNILLGLMAVAVIATLAFIIWAETPLQPKPAALAALHSDAQVTVSLDKFIVFQPATKKATTAFVFYPGGHVDYRSYAAPLHRIAAEGYLVVLLPVRLNLAFFDVNAADRAINSFPDVKHWIVGGHSLGGVAAALYASNQSDLDGLVFWASYPGDGKLKSTKIKTLSIYGTRDMGGTESFEASRVNLPTDTEFVVIKGGNHSQFGDYGLQPGDNQATITRDEQQSQIVAATVKFLQSLSR